LSTPARKHHHEKLLTKEGVDLNKRKEAETNYTEENLKSDQLYLGFKMKSFFKESNKVVILVRKI